MAPTRTDVEVIADLLRRTMAASAPYGLTAPCRVWQGYSQRYGRVSLRGKVGLRTHQVMWALHYGNPAPGMCVCHACDNPRCIEITHLHLGTHQDNMREMSERGRVVFGARFIETSLRNRPLDIKKGWKNSAAKRRAMTNCPKCGDEYKSRPTGKRFCPTCARVIEQNRKPRPHRSQRTLEV